MEESIRNGKKWVTLHPGDHYVCNEDMVLATLLGSCVSACLYDPVNKVSGMNHFLLSNKRYSMDLPIFRSEAGRYGIHSMEILINDMVEKGAKRQFLRAKAFGGGNVLGQEWHDNFFCVGKVNSKFILDYLSIENIPLEAQSLGGEIGRLVRFFTSDYAVYVKPIEKIKQEKIYEKEHRYWKDSLKDQKKNEADITLW